ncbi:MAG: carbonic anhydrase [Halobacteriales archaeon]
MTRATLAALLERNAAHVAGLAPDHFDAVRDGQAPAAVSMCCSDSRVPQAAMWAVDETGWLFTPSTIGNQVWDCVDGQLVVDGSVLYPLVETGTRVAIVVGHTGCGAVAAAHHLVTAGDVAHPPGIAKRVELLRPVVAEALDSGAVAPDADVGVVDQLVERNVDRQVAFLRAADEVPDGVDVYGFVYDFQGVYGDVPGRAYLVNRDGETDEAALAAGVAEHLRSHVRRLR